MHQAGKTDEARLDLARLALIRQEREEAARKREERDKGNGEMTSLHVDAQFLLLYSCEEVRKNFKLLVINGFQHYDLCR